jgi:hypothetical protein
MNWILFAITTLLIISSAWFFFQHKNEERRDRKIFEEYLRKSRKITGKKPLQE